MNNFNISFTSVEGVDFENAVAGFCVLQHNPSGIFRRTYNTATSQEIVSNDLHGRITYQVCYWADEARKAGGFKPFMFQDADGNSTFTVELAKDSDEMDLYNNTAKSTTDLMQRELKRIEAVAKEHFLNVVLNPDSGVDEDPVA